jgi:dTDP-4-dehydrorhamnose reductase
MRIFVSGRDGQVARSLAERGPSIDWIFAARPDCDLGEPGRFASAIAAASPDLVINAAAYTAVDRAEEEEALAHRINADAAGEGAEAAACLAIPFVQLSTDYVFDGSGTRPWREDDPVAPLGAYGRTKAAGEAAVLAASPKHSVVRTSWLVGPFGHNFAKTMLRLAADRDAIGVVADQHGCPTSTLDLADALIELAGHSVAGRASGIWHLAGKGAATWADLAEAIFDVSAANGGPTARVTHITTAEYPTAAKRPANSVLDATKAGATLGIALQDWRAGVRAFVPRLLDA